MLTGKVALVTGGASGIGKEVALKMAEYGAKVAILDFNAESAKKVADEIVEGGEEAIGIFCDVSKHESCIEAVRSVVKTFGTVDIAANCAGINIGCKTIDMTDDVWDRINNIDLKGTLYICQEVAKIMRDKKYGHIVNIASISGKTPEDCNGAYCVAKAGVIMLTKVLALELAELGINANCVCPGPTNTVLMQDVFKERSAIVGISEEEWKEQFLSDIPLHRMGEPEEVSELVCFLASDKASYITGCDYTIAGGKIWN